jgi:hypothetical protein
MFMQRLRLREGAFDGALLVDDNRSFADVARLSGKESASSALPGQVREAKLLLQGRARALRRPLQVKPDVHHLRVWQQRRVS